MTDNLINVIICPNCKKLISADEDECPYCGIKSPGSRWKLIVAKAGRGDIVTQIIYANVIFYVLSIIIIPSQLSLSASPFSFLSPSNNSLLLLGATGTVPIDRFGRWWSLVTAAYLHGSLLHIIFNMMALKQVGALLVSEYGAGRMFVIYTLGSVAGYLLSYIAGVPFTIGASGAVCALIGAGLYYGKSRGGVYGQRIFKDLYSWVIILALFGFIVPGINNWAHGGGVAGGIAAGYMLGYKEVKKENLLHRSLYAICIAATLLSIAWAVLSALFIVMSS
ncbi:MAG: rhomboid family intramembrane serine protease [bacterium]|nr:rhomboid family intramembrane serine protease [bacterium]